MAKGRFLCVAISTSDRIGELSDRAFRIWTMCLPHADRDGRIPASPRKLCRKCFPDLLLSQAWTLPDVETAINELVTVGLWIPLEDDHGVPFFEYFQFQKHQRGMRYDRESESDFTYSGVIRNTSGTDPDQTRTESGTHPPQVKLNLSLKEENEKARPRAKSIDHAGETSDSAKKQEAHYQRPVVLAAIAKALGKPEFIPSAVDCRSMVRFAALIAACPDLDAFCAWAVPPLRERKPIREHWIADVLPLLNDYVPGRNGNGHATVLASTGPPSWIEEARAKGWT